MIISETEIVLKNPNYLTILIPCVFVLITLRWKVLLNQHIIIHYRMIVKNHFMKEAFLFQFIITLKPLELLLFD